MSSPTDNAKATEDFAMSKLVSEFLQDIGVALGSEYADPAKPFFRLFLPHYGRLRDLPLNERLITAFEHLDFAAQQQVRLIVNDSLERCASSPLGVWRSLVVIDLFHHTSLNGWRQQVLGDLLLRPVTAEERAVWIDQLVQRWTKWNLKVHVPATMWIQSIEVVAPSALLRLMRYLLREVSRDIPADWWKLPNAALARLRQHPEPFAKARLDLVALKHEFIGYTRDTSQDIQPSEVESHSDAFELNELMRDLTSRGFMSSALPEENWADT